MWRREWEGDDGGGKEKGTGRAENWEGFCLGQNKFLGTALDRLSIV